MKSDRFAEPLREAFSHWAKRTSDRLIRRQDEFYEVADTLCREMPLSRSQGLSASMMYWQAALSVVAMGCV
ncbi:MAG: hypothetical protein AAFX01_10515 [Cyanobacteria bacterium J06638_28]